MNEQNLAQQIFYAAPNDENQTWTDVPDISNILRIMAARSRSNEPQRKQTNKNLLLWWMLKFRNDNAYENLINAFDPEKVVKAIEVLLNVTVDEAMITDQNGNTLLMNLLNDVYKFEEYKEFLVPLVESFKNTPGALTIKNKNGENALHIAAINFPYMPYIFGYLATAMIQKEININEILDKDGNTFLHTIAKKGDLYVEIVEEMLKLIKHSSYYNISCRNAFGQTALHAAVCSHSSSFSYTKCLKIIKVLIENGVDLTIKDITGETFFHVAFLKNYNDFDLFEVLLKFANSLINEKNNDGQTALHIAAKYPIMVKLREHQKVCELLLKAGALMDVRDTRGMTPLDLVILERKIGLQKLFLKYRNFIN